MKKIKKNKTAKRLRFLKRWGLLIGIALIILGCYIIDNWGFSWVESQVLWYKHVSEELNGYGVLGMIVICIGALFLILWLVSIIVLKSSTPCPACGGLLSQRSPVCPHCKSDLNWGKLDSAQGHLQQQDENIRYCAFCGTKVACDNVYCPVCGKKIMN